MNRIDLEGRVAVITGGASGVGLATARRFLESGARVAIWDQSEALLDQAREDLKSLGSCHAAVVDVSSFDPIMQAADAVEAALGGIDILVNSAGISRRPRAISEFVLQDWHDIMAVNLTGVFLCCRAVVPRMQQRGYGRVVNIASMAGKEGNPLETAYAAAKAGVICLTKSLGKELGKTGVIVNAVAPGVLTTPLRTSQVQPELVQALLQRTPMARPGESRELAALIAWMASEDCSYTTGFTFDFSGGRATY